MWLQRSQIAWLKEGDRNTKYFQCKAVTRAKKNRISRLMADDGHITKDMKIMQHMTTSFFKRLYTDDLGVYLMRWLSCSRVAFRMRQTLHFAGIF
jgi:hypothetical protein